MIPVEVGLISYRVAHYNNEKNEKQLRLSLDLINEVRMDAEQKVAHYKNLMTKHHDALVKPGQFNIGDLILKRVSLATKDPAHGKLGPNWEGPYRVINSKRRGSYYLEALDGRKLEHPFEEVLPDDTRKNYNSTLVHDGSSWSTTSTRESHDEENSSLAKQEGRDFS